MEPYPFQLEAIKKLTQPKITSRLLGDEMGLGKTAQALWIDKKNRQDCRAQAGGYVHYKTLIVGSHIVLQNAWLPALKKIAPSARVVVVDPKNRGAFISALQDPGIHYYLVHYEGVRIMVDNLTQVDWFHIIADEVHRIKNRKAKVTHALKSLTARYKTGISGTPAEDKPQDFWSVVNWLWPQYYRSYWKFTDAFCVSELKENRSADKAYKKIVGVQNSSALRAEIDDWYVRRLKTDVVKDLPEKTYADPYWVDLTPRQRRAYDMMRDQMITWVGENEDYPLPAPVVIAQLTRLQQFALGDIDPYSVYVKRRDRENGGWILDENGNPQLFEQTKYNIVDPSAKLDALEAIIERNPTQQLVVFSQFKSMINLTGRRLAGAKIPHALLTGDVEAKDRGRLVETFQRGDTQVFAATIATGGEGITLTAANTGVFLDRSWKPAANFQAEDRLHRIGQKNPVQIIDIMARDTVDIGRKEHIEFKWDLIKQLLGE